MRTLSPTSYIVLGLLERQAATPYELKAQVARGLGNFWSVQHAQLYTETARLAEEGLLSERREKEGRRRKTYSITTAGRQALKKWLAEPALEVAELRDLGMLKIFFGSPPSMIAVGQLEIYKAKLAEYEELDEALRGVEVPQGMRLTLEVGINHIRETVRSWDSLV